MTTLYKLTTQDWATRGPTKWGPGVSHSGTGTGNLCGPGWIHAYTDPLLAILFNPIHANFRAPVLWEAVGDERAAEPARAAAPIDLVALARQAMTYT